MPSAYEDLSRSQHLALKIDATVRLLVRRVLVLLDEGDTEQATEILTAMVREDAQQLLDELSDAP